MINYIYDKLYIWRGFKIKFCEYKAFSDVFECMYSTMYTGKYAPLFYFHVHLSPTLSAGEFKIMKITMFQIINL